MVPPDSDEPEEDLSEAPATADSVEALLAGALGSPAAASIPAIAPDTVVADRFVVERLLGVGGMGAVYLARDRVLGRAVALKLHRTAAAGTRLHREAVAMARLAHPNVVTVFEVGAYDERPFVAMEYVEGQTLRGWLAEETRTRRQIIEALLAAGEGLAAAHDAGLVHRDIKPDNILVGRDGRVRVGDFGLAQAAAPGEGPIDVPLTPTTATGTVVGTPAYMAPEQLDGGLVDARSDQFAFCVVVWEALCGGRPFGGADTRELRGAIDRGAPRAARGKLPARFRRVLARGFAVDPAARWPSMRALLAGLRAARRRPAVLAAGGASASIIAAVATWALWPAHDPVAACDDIAAPLDREVPVAATDAIVERVRAMHSGNGLRAQTVQGILDGQRSSARAVALSACRAHASKQWSRELARASAECLDDHAKTVKEMLAPVMRGAMGTADLLMVASALPSAEPCGDARLLAGWQSLSRDSAQLATITSARARIESALAQLSLGRVAEAAAIAEELEREPVAKEPAVQHRAELLRGMLEIARSDIASGEARLAKAYFAARADDDGMMALRLVGELIRVTATMRRDAQAAERWIQNGIADAEREHTRHPGAAAEVYLRAASAATIVGDGELALKHVDRSDAVRGSSPAVHRGGSSAIRSDALALLGRTDEALAASDRYLEGVRTLGESHPIFAEALVDRAALLIESNRIEPGLAAARQAKAIIDAEGDKSSVTVAGVELTLGATLLHIEDPSARGYLEHAREIYVRTYGEQHPDVALVDTNLAIAYMDAGEGERALAALRQAAIVTEKTIGPDHLDLAATLYNLAVSERQAGDYTAALATARRTAAIFESQQKGSVRHIYALGHIAMILNLLKQHAEAVTVADAALALPRLEDDTMGLSWLRLELARGLIHLRRDRARAEKLLDEARAGYASINLPDRLREIDALRTAPR